MTSAQHHALHPHKNIWVTASAGSGKTKVLTDRLLRLMLEGSDPQKLLCLTFTRAAAAEMLHRLQQRLSLWTICQPPALAQELTTLLGWSPTPAITQRARHLFTLFLDQPTQIQTLHSFCQGLLQRFPLEAGLSVPFRVLDEQAELQLWKQAYGHILDEARTHLPLQETLLRLMAPHSEFTLWDHLCELFSHRMMWPTPPVPSQAVLLPEAPSAYGFPETALSTLATVLEAQGNPKDWQAFEILKGGLSQPYIDLFVTQAGTPRQRLFSRPILEALPVLAQWIETEQQTLIKMLQTRNLQRFIQMSTDYLALFSQILHRYEQLKKADSAIDFNDLILKTTDLIRCPESMGWVLYKLDHAIDHLLVDEAQDTSIEQWRLIRSIGESLITTSHQKKTLFIVGDPKQSIYSFQRADPEALYETKEFFKLCAQQAGALFEDVILDTSFRSTPPILALLNRIFKDVSLTPDPYPLHIPCPALKDKGGHVELWPLVYADEEDHPTTRLAEAWALRVKEWLKTPFYVETEQRLLQPGDIMILLSKRDSLFDALIKAFHRHGLPISGHDRLCLQTQLVIQDLMMLIQWLLMPEDDWALACVLKGSLLGCSEDTLYQLSYNRKKSLFQALLEAPDTPEITPMRQQLTTWLSLSRTVTPFMAFQEILGGGGLAAIIQRLGPPANEPVEEFLHTLYQYEHEKGSDLTGFFHWFQAHPLTIKRDLSCTTDIRLMTIHGAKGLESPIVILPDICALPRTAEHFFYLSEPFQGVLLAPKSGDLCPLTRPLANHIQQKALQEHRRLLYVALTRAKERLYCSGWVTGKSAPEDSWYSLLLPAFQALGTPIPFHGPWKGDSYCLSHTGPVTPKPLIPPFLKPFPTPLEFPGLPIAETPEEISEEAFHEMLSSQALIGKWVHQLLEELPAIAPKHREQRAVTFLRHQGCSVKSAYTWTRRILDVFAQFPFLWGPHIRSEAAFSFYDEKGHRVKRMDRLILTKTGAWVIDFKTDKHPPYTWEDSPLAYRHQLMGYRALLRSLYPTLPAHMGILWVRSCALIWSPDSMGFPPE